MPVILLILGIVLAAILVKLAIAAVAFIAAHLVIVVASVVLGAICFLAFLRLLFSGMEKLVVSNWHSQLGQKPRRRELPVPFEHSTMSRPGRPFTLPAAEPEPEPELEKGEVVAAVIPASTLLACEGPDCMSSLPKEPEMRWRIGSSTVPQTSRDSVFPDAVEDVHEFCSEACLRRWTKERGVSSGL